MYLGLSELRNLGEGRRPVASCPWGLRVQSLWGKPVLPLSGLLLPAGQSANCFAEILGLFSVMSGTPSLLPRAAWVPDISQFGASSG